MVAKGYKIVFSTPVPKRWVIVSNPWGPQGRCGPGNASGPFGGDLEIDSYAEFVGGPGFNHTHGGDIYNVVHK